MLTLYQAEWCPFSSAVRERLTELGLTFVAVPVEPWPDDRRELVERFGTDEIPVLVTDEGEAYVGTLRILKFLATLPAGEHEEGHRRRYNEHGDARKSDATGRILERVAPLPE